MFVTILYDFSFSVVPSLWFRWGTTWLSLTWRCSRLNTLTRHTTLTSPWSSWTGSCFLLIQWLINWKKILVLKLGARLWYWLTSSCYASCYTLSGALLPICCCTSGLGLLHVMSRNCCKCWYLSTHKVLIEIFPSSFNTDEDTMKIIRKYSGFKVKELSAIY